MWRDAAWLTDMVRAGRQALSYVEDLDQARFETEILVQDAVLRQLMIVGEAAKNVSQEFRAAHSDVPWQAIGRFRDILVHHYFKVDLDQVWEILQSYLPAMIIAVEPLIPSLDEKE